MILREGKEEKRAGWWLKRLLLVTAGGTLLAQLAVAAFVFDRYVTPSIAARTHDQQRYSARLIEGLARVAAIPENYFRGLTTNPELLTIDIKHTNVQKLAYKRQVALDRGALVTSSDDFVPATIRHGNQTLKAKLRLKGDLLDHIMDPNKVSYRVKLKGDDTLFGMKQFSLQQPKTRAYLSEWVLHRFARHEGLISLRYRFVDLVVNGKPLGLFALEEHIDKRLIENNGRRNGPVIRFDESNWWAERLRFIRDDIDDETLPGISDYFSLPIDAFQSGKVLDDPVLKNGFAIAQTMLDKFRRGELTTSQVFDIDLMGRYLALNDMFGNNHAIHTNQYRFYYNPVTSRLEPIPFGMGTFRRLVRLVGIVEGPSGFLRGTGQNLFLTQLFDDPLLWRAYVQALERFSDDAYLESLLADIAEPMQSALDELYTEYPYYSFDTNLFATNQAYIRSILDPAEAVLAYLEESDARRTQLEVGNIQGLPIEISGLISSGTTFNLAPGEDGLLSGKSPLEAVRFRKLSFDVPAALDIDLSNSHVLYRVVGSSKVKEATISSWAHHSPQFKLTSFLRNSTELADLAFLELDEEDKTIRFKPGRWTIDQHLVLPGGYQVLAGPGVELDIVDSAILLSRSPLEFIGTQENPVLIGSSDGTGQGLLVMGAKKRSTLKHVAFHNLAYPSQGGWSTSGAVTFYDSPVSFDHTLFSSNHSEDALNLIQSPFSITACIFENSQSDAFDADFSDGSIRDTLFLNSGNDAIDVSGSNLELSQVVIQAAADKGLSAGEASEINARGISILDTEIGVASKDRSAIHVDGLALTNVTVGFAVFQKKSEFGPADVTATRVTDDQVNRTYLVERGSTLTVNNAAVETHQDRVRQLLYGEEYGTKTERP